MLLRAFSEITAAVKKWPHFADTAGVPSKQRGQIARTHRLTIDRPRRPAKK